MRKATYCHIVNIVNSGTCVQILSGLGTMAITIKMIHVFHFSFMSCMRTFGKWGGGGFEISDVHTSRTGEGGGL